jgi:hypothetical protein
MGVISEMGTSIFTHEAVEKPAFESGILQFWMQVLVLDSPTLPE